MMDAFVRNFDRRCVVNITVVGSDTTGVPRILQWRGFTGEDQESSKGAEPEGLGVRPPEAEVK